MSYVEVVDKIPESYKKEFIRESINGKSYLTESGDVYKQFKPKTVVDHRKMHDLNDARSKDLALPTRLVYLATMEDAVPAIFDGYRCPPILGTRHDDLDPDTTRIDAIISAANKLESEIIRVAKQYGIILSGLNMGNVVLREDGTYGLNDTDLYDINHIEDEYDNIKQSMMEWNGYLLGALGSELGAFKSETLNLHHEIALENGKYRASRVALEVMKEIRNQTGEEPVTLGDYQKGVQLIRRK